MEYKYVASGGQTTFTGTDANGATLSYAVSNVHVFLNGVRLDASDITATNGTSIVLGSGAVASDELVIIAWKSFLSRMRFQHQPGEHSMATSLSQEICE